MNHKNIFITGTDTGVGKTFISSLIIFNLIREGIFPGYIKPIETGLGNSLIPVDYNFVKNLNPGILTEVKDAVPFRFKYPLSPYDAAIKERKKIEIDELLNSIKKIIGSYEYNVIEGAGGVYVPITESITMLDLIKLLDIPVLVVGRCGLGTINHTCLTINALLLKKIQVNSFILNGKNYNKSKSNAINIERITGVKCSGLIPFIKKKDCSVFSEINIKIEEIFK